MTLPIILLVAIAAAAVFFFRMISMNKSAALTALDNQRQKVKAKYEFVASRRQELERTVDKKEKEITTLKNNQEGIKILSAKDMDISDENNDDKISRYLMTSGKITMEQNETALQKMGVLKMDFLGTCMALGFIDLKTSKEALKANKVSGNKLKLGDD